MKETGQALDTAFVFFAGSQLFKKLRLNSTTLARVTFLYGVARATISWATTSSETKEKPILKLKKASSNHASLYAEVMQDLSKKRKKMGVMTLPKNVWFRLEQLFSSTMLSKLATYNRQARCIYTFNQWVDTESQRAQNLFYMPCGRITAIVVQEKRVPRVFDSMERLNHDGEIEGVLQTKVNKVILHLERPNQRKAIFCRIVKLTLAEKAGQKDLKLEDLEEIMAAVRCQFPFPISQGKEPLGFDKEDIVAFWSYAEECNRIRQCHSIERRALSGVTEQNAYKLLMKYCKPSARKPEPREVKVRLGEMPFVFGPRDKIQIQNHSKHAKIIESKNFDPGETLTNSKTLIFGSNSCTVQIMWEEMGKKYQLIKRHEQISQLVHTLESRSPEGVAIQHAGLWHEGDRSSHFATFVLALATGFNHDRSLEGVCSYVIRLWSVCPELFPTEEDFKLLLKYRAHADNNLGRSSRSRSTSPHLEEKLHNNTTNTHLDAFNKIAQSLQIQTFPNACLLFINQTEGIKPQVTDEVKIGDVTIRLVSEKGESSSTGLVIEEDTLVASTLFGQCQKVIESVELAGEGSFDRFLKVALAVQSTKGFLAPVDVFRIIYELMHQRKGFRKDQLKQCWSFAQDLNIEKFKLLSVDQAFERIQTCRKQSPENTSDKYVGVGGIWFNIPPENGELKGSTIEASGNDWKVTTGGQDWTFTLDWQKEQTKLQAWADALSGEKASDVYFKRESCSVALMLAVAIKKNKSCTRKELYSWAYALWTRVGTFPTKQEFKALLQLGNGETGSQELKNTFELGISTFD